MQVEDDGITEDTSCPSIRSLASFGSPGDTLHALDLAQVCIRSLEGTIRFWSCGNERLYGWSSEDAIGKITHQLLKTEFPKPILEINAELLKSGQWEGELQHRAKNGTPLWVASNWILQRGSEDSAPYVVEVSNDVTGLKRADETRQYLATIVESSDDAIISKNLDGLVTSWNAGAERIFGYTAPEIVGKPITILFPSQLVAEESEIMAKLHRGERVDHYETLRLTKSGHQIAVSLTISPLYDGQGVLIGASKIVRDITQRKEWESALIAAENRRRLAVEAGELGLWSFESSAPGPTWDAACKQIFGFSADEPSPLYDEALQFVHPDDRAAVESTFGAMLTKGSPFDMEFRVIDRHGQLHWVETKGRPAFNPDQVIVGAHGTILDFTLRKQKEEALLRANRELEQFAYAAAHDLQEPLRNVALTIGLAKRELKDHVSEQGEAYLDYAVESAERMHSMVRDLLAYTKIVSDDSDLVPVSDANEVLAQALQNLSTAIHASSAQVLFGKLPSVTIRPIHLLQLFQNLIANSLNYSSSEPPVIRIAATLQSGYQQFAVKDNGIGIDPQFHARVFGVFRRLREKDTPGTGMGLAICKRIVEHYGGKIWIESEKNQGAKFLFTLPAAPGKPAGQRRIDQ